MRFCLKNLVVALLLAVPAAGYAASCTTQGELLPQDRDALVAVGNKLASAVLQQNLTSLQGALLPSEATEWEGMRGAVEQAAPILKNGQIQIRSLYVLDATGQTEPTDAQFFCSNTTGTLTVTVWMRGLPPGRYAVVLADAPGSAMAGQMALILVWQSGPTPGWKLGGLSIRQGTFGGHDGVWFWSRARELARLNMTWSAWYCYEAARMLLVPVDFLSSPNLEKLNTEQAQLHDSPQQAFPYSLSDGPRNWKIDSITVDPSLYQADLGVTYESTGVTDPAALRTEAAAVMSGLLKAQPGLRQNFHGMWAYAVKDGKRTPIIELPMEQIP